MVGCGSCVLRNLVWVNTASPTIISSLIPSRAYLRILYPLWTSSNPRTNDLLKGQITFYTERTVSRSPMTYKSRLNGTTLSYVKFFEKFWSSFYSTHFITTCYFHSNFPRCPLYNELRTMLSVRTVVEWNNFKVQ